MNEKQELFADMLGIRRNPPAPSAAAPAGPGSNSAVGTADPGSDSVEPASDLEGGTAAPGAVDELDVQRVVVEEMAGEKAELEERSAALKGEIVRLAAENATLKAEKASFAAEKDELLREVEDLKASLDEAHGLHDALETKITRLGRVLMALRRELAEAKKVEIGGRRW